MRIIERMEQTMAAMLAVPSGHEQAVPAGTLVMQHPAEHQLQPLTWQVS